MHARCFRGVWTATGALLTRIPTIDNVLNDHATALRDDFFAYRNHVYRIVNLCAAIVGRSELEKIAVAAVFHDLGIWTNGTFDYIAPSIALAHDYLVACAHQDWTTEIEGMIADHHKITPSTADPDSRGPPEAGVPPRERQCPAAAPAIAVRTTGNILAANATNNWNSDPHQMAVPRACGAQEVGICLSC